MDVQQCVGCDVILDMKATNERPTFTWRLPLRHTTIHKLGMTPSGIASFHGQCLEVTPVAAAAGLWLKTRNRKWASELKGHITTRKCPLQRMGLFARKPAAELCWKKYDLYHPCKGTGWLKNATAHQRQGMEKKNRTRDPGQAVHAENAGHTAK